MTRRLYALTVEVKLTPMCSLTSLVLHPMQDKRKQEPMLWLTFSVPQNHRMALVDADVAVGVRRV